MNSPSSPESIETRLQTLLVVALLVYGANLLATTLEFAWDNLGWSRYPPDQEGFLIYLRPALALVAVTVSLVAVRSKGGSRLRRVTAHAIALFLILAPISGGYFVVVVFGFPTHHDPSFQTLWFDVAHGTLLSLFKGALGIWIFVCLRRTRK